MARSASDAMSRVFEDPIELDPALPPGSAGSRRACWFHRHRSRRTSETSSEPGLKRPRLVRNAGVRREPEEPHSLPVRCHRCLADGGDPLAEASVTAAVAVLVVAARDSRTSIAGRRRRGRRRGRRRRPRRSTPAPGRVRGSRRRGWCPGPGRSSIEAVVGERPALTSCRPDVQKLPCEPEVRAAAPTNRVESSGAGRHDGQSTVIRRSPVSVFLVVPTISRMGVPAASSRESQESVSLPRQFFNSSSSLQAPAINS